MENMIEGSVSEPYAPNGPMGALPICCDVTVTVRILNGKGYEALLKLMDKAQDISTAVDFPF